MTDPLVAVAIIGVPAMVLFAVLASRWPALAVCLVPLSFPIEQLDLPGLPVPVVYLASLGAIGLVVLHQRTVRQAYVPSSAILLGAGLVVLSALVSTVVAVDPVTALRLDAGYLLGLGFAAAIVMACPGPGPLRLVVGATCLVGAVICGAGLRTAGDLRAHFGGSVVDNRGTGFFGQPNELGTFAAVIVLLSLGLVFSTRTRWARAAAVASVLLSFSALVVSLSRGSWIGVGLGLLVFLVLAPRARLPVLGGLGVISAGIAAAAAALPGSPLLSIVVDRAVSLLSGQRNPYDDRPAIWAEALRQIAVRPILGSGPGGYPAIAVYRPSGVSTVAPDHAHDLLLTVTAEQGLLGLFALAGAVSVAVVAVARTVRWIDSWPGWGSAAQRPGHRERATLASVAGALAVVLGEGLLDYPLRNAVLASTVWLLLGLLAAAVARRTQEGTASRQLRRGARTSDAGGSQWPYPAESVPIAGRPNASRRLDG